MLSSIVDCEDLERVKENIPLPSLSLWTKGSNGLDDDIFSLVKMVDYANMNFEQLDAAKSNLRSKMIVDADDYFSNADVDPLVSSTEYIDFLCKYYVISGKSSFKDWVSALEWVTRKFAPSSGTNNSKIDAKSQAFSNDPRYIRFWCYYAKCCQDPEIVFQYMMSQGIGSMVAVFYETYAEYVGYYQKRVSDALRIFKLGMDSHARPQKRLQDSLSIFQHKVMLEIESNPEAFKKAEDKQALASIFIPQQTLSDGQDVSKYKMKIYCDDEKDESFEKIPFFLRPWSKYSAFPDAKSSWKENTLIASPWMGVTLIPNKPLPIPKKSFHVYRYDNEDTARASVPFKNAYDANILMFNGIPDYFSFEEIRAHDYTNGGDKVEISESMGKQFHEKTESKLAVSPIITVSPIVLESPAKIASPTIHTKLAEQDVLAFCNEPLENELWESPPTEKPVRKMMVFHDDHNAAATELHSKINDLHIVEPIKCMTSEKRDILISSPPNSHNPMFLSTNELGSPCIFSPSFRRSSSSSHSNAVNCCEDRLVDWSNENELVTSISRIQKQLCKNPLFHPISSNFKGDYLFSTSQNGWSPLDLGNNISLKLVKKLDDKETFLAMSLNSSLPTRKLIVKIRESAHQNMWEFYVCCKAETVDVFGLFLYHDKSVLLMQFFDSENLSKVLEIYERNGERIHEFLAGYYALSLLRTMLKLHKLKIVHGNINPSILYVRMKDDDDDDELPAISTSISSEGFCEGVDRWFDRHDLILTDFTTAIDLSLYDDKVGTVIISPQTSAKPAQLHDYDSVNNVCQILQSSLGPDYQLLLPWTELSDFLSDQSHDDFNRSCNLLEELVMRWTINMNDFAFSQPEWTSIFRMHEIILMDS